MIILKLLNKKPNMRYQSATGVLVDINLCLTQKSQSERASVGQVDSILNFLFKFRYPVKVDELEQYTSFVLERTEKLSVLIVSGQEPEIQSDSLQQLMKHHALQYEVCVIKAEDHHYQANQLLKHVVHHYFLLLAKSSSTVVHEFVNLVCYRLSDAIGYIRMTFLMFDAF